MRFIYITAFSIFSISSFAFDDNCVTSSANQKSFLININSPANDSCNYLIKSQIAPRLADYITLTNQSTPKYFSKCGNASLITSNQQVINFNGKLICNDYSADCPYYKSGWTWGKVVAQTLVYEKYSDNRSKCQNSGVESCLFKELQNLVDDSLKAQNYGMHWLSGSCDIVPIIFLAVETAAYVASAITIFTTIRRYVKKRNNLRQVIQMEAVENFL